MRSRGDGPAEPHLHQLGAATDGVQGRAERVAHHGQELALRVVGALRLLACFALRVEEPRTLERLRALLRKGGRERAVVPTERASRREAESNRAEYSPSTTSGSAAQEQASGSCPSRPLVP